MPDLLRPAFLFIILAGVGKCDKLNELRKKMAEADLAAYIVTNTDYHLSEMPASRDVRRQWLSGFTGSWGDAVVGKDWAALFTDSRYTIQAKRQLSKDWILPDKKANISTWLSGKLSKGEKIGVDPKTISSRLWLDIKQHVSGSGIELVAVEENLIDKLWTDRPSYPDVPLFVHDLKYSGQNYSTKVSKVRQKMSEANSSVLVLSVLDEIAWLLNLRGGDLPYTPVFASFLVLTPDEGTLYIRPQLDTELVRKHLNQSEAPISIKNITEFWKDWNVTSKECARCFVPFKSSYYIYSAVADERRQSLLSPVVNLRAFKTALEVEASRQAHVSDAIALCQLFKTLEERIDDRRWRESDVSMLIGNLRSDQPDNRGRSFPDIVAAGANAALPHYIPDEKTDSSVNSSTVIMIDSGGQYLGGTTDVTRVLHLGDPRPVEVDVYSRLLRGVATLGSAFFPEGISYAKLDILLKQPLYKAGLDYGHGSTHGTGVFLSVHEEFNLTYYENFIGSQEPGYYEENEFGMRLENLVVVVAADTKYKNKTDHRFMTFSPLTLVPYERKLINASVLEDAELKWVNQYHQEVLKTVGEEIQKRGDNNLYQWLVKKTAPIVKK